MRKQKVTDENLKPNMLYAVGPASRTIKNVFWFSVAQVAC